MQEPKYPLTAPYRANAVRDERFYILTHQKIKGAIETRMMDMLLERPPTDTSRPRK